MANCIMGIDVGTTGTKTAIMDDTGKLVSLAYREYGCTYPKPGWVEQDVDMLVSVSFQTAAEALAKSGLNGSDIAGIAVSAQRCCTVFVDKEGKLVRPMISWQDNRTPEEVELIRTKVSDEDFYDTVRLPQSSTWMLSKILWLQRNEKEAWSRTARVVQLHDYVLHAWGAESFYVDHSDSAFYGCWDTSKLQWDQRLLKVADLRPAMLSEPRPSGSKAGMLSAFAASKTGLAAGTPLCIGAGDQNAGALGAGVVRPGLLSVSLGTGGAVAACADHPFHDASRKTMVTNHVMNGRWLVEGYQAGAASVFRWFRDQFAGLESAYAKAAGRDPYDVLTELIGQAPAGSKGLLLLPYFASAATPRWNSAARGTLVGMTFAHDRYCMARSYIEGITLEVRDMLESLVSAGITFERVHLLGGPTKSELWNQIQADVYGHTVCTLSNTDAAVTGAAILAGVGVGLFPDAAAGVENLVKIRTTYTPDNENHRRYDELYGIYTDLYAAMAGSGVYERLVDFQTKYSGEEA
jgi:xylulokinase